jgi:hypothetical protein
MNFTQNMNVTFCKYFILLTVVSIASSYPFERERERDDSHFGKIFRMDLSFGGCGSKTPVYSTVLDLEGIASKVIADNDKNINGHAHINKVW